LHIYNYSQASDRFIDFDDRKINASLEEFEDYYIRINITNGKEGEKILVKMLYNPRWHEINGNRIGIGGIVLTENGLPLMTLELKQNGNYSVELVYENSMAERIIQALPFAVLIILSLIVIFMNRTDLKNVKL